MLFINFDESKKSFTWKLNVCNLEINRIRFRRVIIVIRILEKNKQSIKALLNICQSVSYQSAFRRLAIVFVWIRRQLDYLVIGWDGGGTRWHCWLLSESRRWTSSALVSVTTDRLVYQVGEEVKRVVLFPHVQGPGRSSIHGCGEWSILKKKKGRRYKCVIHWFCIS